MAELVYAAITSLDGFVTDAQGGFEWAAPADDLHAYVNDRERTVGTYLYGRRMYDVMRFWETADQQDGLTDVARDYTRVWQGADKVVYSRTLERIETGRTRLEREFDPVAVRALVDAAERDVSVGGPTLAAEALRAGIVDRVHQYLHPVVVGGGTPFLPHGVRLDLELVDVGRFDSGVARLDYRVRRQPQA
ncbi:MAG: deaminase [Nocardioidaceae bacterium]|nr:deaminase [Nocardioidaceae bacterium]NUS52879.1 deaminase [Nocardioidaceae bacterium]